MRVHGVPWIIDKLHAAEACEVELLNSGLQVWQAEGAAFLPVGEIDRRLRQLQGEYGYLTGATAKGNFSNTRIALVNFRPRATPGLRRPKVRTRRGLEVVFI